MTQAARAIGVILPSSNRMVERVTRSILAGFPGLDACFARVPYAGHPADGYTIAPFRQAAALLAEAHPDVIVWNATRGAALGFAPDRRLCAMIERETGVPATTTALATIALLRGRGLRRIGLLAQGDDAEGARLTTTFAREGITIAAGRNLGIADNFSAAQVAPDEIADEVIGLAAQGGIDAILVWSTNLAGHALAPGLSTRLGLPVLDSTTIGVRQAIASLEARAPCSAAAGE